MNKPDTKQCSSIGVKKSNAAPSQAVNNIDSSEAILMHNSLSYQASRINELSIILFERLEYYMTAPYPTAGEDSEKEGFSSGYFRSLSIANQPVNEAIGRLEEIIRRLAL